MRYLINTALTCRLSQKWRRHGYCHLKRGEIMPDIINSVKEEFINEYIRKIDTAIETYNATIGSNDEIFDLVIEISNVFENDIPNLQTSVLIRTGTEIRDANIVRAMLIKYLADNGIEYKGKGIEENVKEKRFWNSFIHWFETELPGLELLDGKYLRWDNWDGGMWFIELDYDHEFTLYRGTVYPSPLSSISAFTRTVARYCAAVFSLLICNSKIIQVCFISILCCQASISQIPFFIVPFFQSSIIKHFQIILDNKWNNIVFQAFLEHNQTSHTTISILKWMDTFKLHMKIQNIVKGLFFLVIVL